MQVVLKTMEGNWHQITNLRELASLPKVRVLIQHQGLMHKEVEIRRGCSVCVARRLHLETTSYLVHDTPLVQYH